jgi:hypothetical protein
MTKRDERHLRPRGGRWPSRRRSRAPNGYCGRCWAEGGPPVPGQAFVWGYPYITPGEGPTNHYCESHAAECRAMNITLIPGEVPRRPQLQLVKGGAP